MSPLAFGGRSRTTVEINPPTLSFTKQPSNSQRDSSGNSIFTCSAIATKPNSYSGIADGSYEFKWYYDGAEVISSSTIGSVSSSGADSTLTLTGTTSIQNNKQIYAVVKYLPGNNEGNAINSPLTSNIIGFESDPYLIITKQPVDLEVGTDVEAEFSVEVKYDLDGNGTASIDSDLSTSSLYFYSNPNNTASIEAIWQSISSNNNTTLRYQWLKNGFGISDGQFRDGDALYTASGTKTPNLTLKYNNATQSEKITCIITSSHPNINESITTNEVELKVTAPRNIIHYEFHDTNPLRSRSITLGNQNHSIKTGFHEFLDSSPTFTLDSAESKVGETRRLSGYLAGTVQDPSKNYKLFQFYCLEQDIRLELNIKASAGKNSSTGKTGGAGGTSKIEIDVKKDTEYSILGIRGNDSVFIYEKSTLIAVVGKGGDAGDNGNGGNGGGVNNSGEKGGGNNGGSGGNNTNIPTLTGLSPSGTTGGRTIKCTRGDYWMNLIVDACSDNSDTKIKFFHKDGTEQNISKSLYRGFKSGITFTSNAGISDNTNSGNGGNGANGGNSGTNKCGGGGGSGYKNESITVLESTIGGNTNETSTIEFKLAADTNPRPTRPRYFTQAL